MSETDVRLAEHEDDAAVEEVTVSTEVSETEAEGASGVPGSTEETEKGRRWLPLLVGGVLVIAIIAVVAILLLTANPLRNGAKSVGPLDKQADWRVQTYPIGGAHPKRKHPPPAPADTEAVTKLVRDVHDALFLFPGNFRETASKYFAGPAMREITSQRAFGVTAGAEKVRTLRRHARIGIDAADHGRAVADVLVVATGKQAGKRFRSLYEASLFLERQDKAWTVIAYNVDQRPLPRQWRELVNPEPKKPVKKPAGPAKDGKPAKGGKQ